MSSSTKSNGDIWWQKAESLVIFALATVSYYLAGGGPLMYFLLLLAFDISMIGYLFNQKLGQFTYNLGHSLLLPLLLLSFAYSQNLDLLTKVSLLWIAHIGMDRSLGYGLKKSKGFKYTHLGRIG